MIPGTCSKCGRAVVDPCSRCELAEARCEAIALAFRLDPGAQGVAAMTVESEGMRTSCHKGPLGALAEVALDVLAKLSPALHVAERLSVEHSVYVAEIRIREAHVTPACSAAILVCRKDRQIMASVGEQLPQQEALVQAISTLANRAEGLRRAGAR